MEEVNFSYKERVAVDFIPWKQRQGMSIYKFCRVAQLKDLYLLIAGKKERRKELV